MTLAEALNILAGADFYAGYNLARPSFFDAGDGKVSVSFRSTRADGQQWGQARFTTLAELQTYISGIDAARSEAAFDAATAAKAAAQAQPATPEPAAGA